MASAVWDRRTPNITTSDSFQRRKYNWLMWLVAFAACQKCRDWRFMVALMLFWLEIYTGKMRWDTVVSDWCVKLHTGLHSRLSISRGIWKCCTWFNSYFDLCMNISWKFRDMQLWNALIVIVTASFELTLQLGWCNVAVATNRSRVQLSVTVFAKYGSCQAAHAEMPLLPGGVTCYWPKDGDAVAGKVTDWPCTN